MRTNNEWASTFTISYVDGSCLQAANKLDTKTFLLETIWDLCWQQIVYERRQLGVIQRSPYADDDTDQMDEYRRQQITNDAQWVKKLNELIRD